MTPVEHWLRHFLIWREPNDPGGFWVYGSGVWEVGGKPPCNCQCLVGCGGVV